MSNISTTTLIGIAVVLLIAGALFLAFLQNTQEERVLSVNSFDECVAAGYSVVPLRQSLGTGGELYPERCVTPDGRTFVNERQLSPSASTTTPSGCVIAGCSGQLCVSAEEAAKVITTCEYRPEYACYKEASCEPQADGKCGWTQTTQLKKCLANPPRLNTPEPVF